MLCTWALLGRLVEVRSRWPSAVGFAGRRGACLDAVRCAVPMPMRCPGRFVPSWRARRGRVGVSALATSLCLVIG